MPRTIRLVPVCVLAFCAAAPLHGADVRDMVEIAYDLMQKEMKPDEWKSYVKNANSRFESWCHDYPDGDIKRYLDDKLLELAPSVLSGSVKALKRMVFWVALYKEYKEPAPAYIREISEKYRKDMDEELANFSWERAAEKIKNRKKELDKIREREEKKKSQGEKGGKEIKIEEKPAKSGDK